MHIRYATLSGCCCCLLSSSMLIHYHLANSQWCVLPTNAQVSLQHPTLSQLLIYRYSDDHLFGGMCGRVVCLCVGKLKKREREREYQVHAFVKHSQFCPWPSKQDVSDYLQLEIAWIKQRIPLCLQTSLLCFKYVKGLTLVCIGLGLVFAIVSDTICIKSLLVVVA